MKMVVVVIALLACVASSARTQEPICIIDGVRVSPSACSMGPIDPRQIDRIEILKGARAAAAFGSDASAGVISITTTRGGGLASPAGDDPLAQHLFPPELVMTHQQAIRLTDRQRAAIQDAMKEAQGKFVELQFRMSAEVETLKRLLQGTSVDEPRVLDQVDRVLALERQIKHVQLGLMIRIKNQLTEEQQTELSKLRR